ncbi:hypothetical protein M3Y96_00997800 [Aphelenchoides besseyi]|nr:hypothetical protein M3Y96_00997800 [Aphelenchoides besseyi]
MSKFVIIFAFHLLTVIQTAAKSDECVKDRLITGLCNTTSIKVKSDLPKINATITINNVTEILQVSILFGNCLIEGRFFPEYQLFNHFNGLLYKSPIELVASINGTLLQGRNSSPEVVCSWSPFEFDVFERAVTTIRLQTNLIGGVEILFNEDVQLVTQEEIKAKKVEDHSWGLTFSIGTPVTRIVRVLQFDI